MTWPDGSSGPKKHAIWVDHRGGELQVFVPVVPLALLEQVDAEPDDSKLRARIQEILEEAR